MAAIHAYLTFSGNCFEAMTFYKECLGGELTLQTVGESPLAERLPRRMKNYVLNAVLTNNALVLMGSDMVPEPGLKKGNAVSMMLHCHSEDEVKRFYAKLSEQGKQTHPLEQTFWGTFFGDLTDKFGNHWMLQFDRPEPA